MIISTDKRAITFYADPEIEKWYESLPGSVRSRTINDLLKKAISSGGKKDVSLEKVAKHDEVLRELIELVTVLSQEQIAVCEQKHKDPHAKSLKKKIKSALGELGQL